jgi:D-alanyl-D-alanine carboxypeptidase
MTDKDLWDKLSVSATAMAVVAVPIIVAIAADALNASLKDQEVKVEVMKLAQDLLKADPVVVDQPGVRDWAKKVLSEYSGVPLTEAAKLELDKQPLLPGESSVDTTDRDPSHLHPALRSKLVQLVAKLQQEGLQFELLEGFRSPARQLVLFATGRLDNGPRVTMAKPWTTTHNFGVAADLVLRKDGKVDFSDLAAYRRMHEVASDVGLKTIDKPFVDWPRVELPDVSVADMRAGKYPADGDESWSANLRRAVDDWTTLTSDQKVG